MTSNWLSRTRAVYAPDAIFASEYETWVSNERRSIKVHVKPVANLRVGPAAWQRMKPPGSV